MQSEFFGCFFAGVLRIKAYICYFTQFTVDQSKLTVNGSVLSDTPNVRYLVALFFYTSVRKFRFRKVCSVKNISSPTDIFDIDLSWQYNDFKLSTTIFHPKRGRQLLVAIELLSIE